MVEKKTLIPRSTFGNLSAIHFLSEVQYRQKNEQKRSLVILCHGLSGDKLEWGRFTKTATMLNEEGFDALLFDFSGSGENTREFITLTKQKRDLEDVYIWANKYGYINIGVIGLSFGGLTALVSDYSLVKVFVFWAPAFYLKDMYLSSIEKSLKNQPMKMPSSGKYDPIEINYSFVEDLLKFDVNFYLQKLSIPILIVQGTKDRNVKPAYSREAFNHMPQDKDHKLVEIDNATHNFDKEYLKRFIEISIEWFKRYI